MHTVPLVLEMECEAHGTERQARRGGAAPLGVVTSCRKLAVSLRTGHSNPRLAKKGAASCTGPWNISCLHGAHSLSMS